MSNRIPGALARAFFMVLLVSTPALLLPHVSSDTTQIDYRTPIKFGGRVVVDAVIHKPKRIATNLGIFLQVMNAVAPKASEVIMNTVFRMFNDSAAARGDGQTEQVEASNEQVALGSLMKGVHF